MKRIPKLNFTQINRFIQQVDQSAEPDDCWLWQGFKVESGYGSFTINGKNFKAHRVSYLLANGSINDELLVLHSCDVRACVNPKHLFQGTPKDNSQDAVSKGRQTKVFGERNGNHKLNRRQVQDIRRMCRERAMTQKAMAKFFGVSETTIYYVSSGERWKKLAR
jgi:DNA-binding XRE family transcriptional regulator